MSHINKIEELKELREYLNVRNYEFLSKDEICNILEFLIPKNEEGKLLTRFTVTNDNLYKVGYLPKYNSIVIPKKKLEKVSIQGAEILNDEVEGIDLRKTIRYYELFALMHEVEHAYQFLISNGKITFKYSEVIEGYKNLADILKGRDYILPHPVTQIRDIVAKIKYYSDDYNYIFERNATIEACNNVKILAHQMEEFNISKAFYMIELSNILKGYLNDNNGCMYETYKKMCLIDKFNKIKKDDSISEEERLRFGLSINEETRKALFKEKKKFE